MRGVSLAHGASTICMKRLSLSARLSRIDHFNIQKWGVEVKGVCSKTKKEVWRAIMKSGEVLEWKEREWVSLAEGVCETR